MGSNVHSDDATPQFVPLLKKSGKKKKSETCTVWPQLMLTGLSRKTGSQRISRENESRFWPDNVRMIFFLLPLREETKHFLATECVWQFHGAPHNMYSDYGGRAIVCRRTFLLLTLCLLAMRLMFSPEITVFVSFFSCKKNSRVYLGLLMTLNLNKRFWLCKGLCAVLSLVFFFF